MKKYLIVGALAALISFPVASNAATRVKSVRCVDGDTCWINNTHKIRLVSIDAPEIETRLLKKSACPDQEKALGLKAKARAVELTDMSHHRVTVKYSKGKDAWGRNLGTIYSDKVSVAKTLMAEGLALPWSNLSKPRPAFVCMPTAIKRAQGHR